MISPKWAPRAIGILLVAAGLLDCGSRTTHEVGFWYEEFPLTLSPTATAMIGGPISDTEASVIKQQSRIELEKAFSGMPLTITDRRDTFWRVSVRPSLPVRRSTQLPAAGETRAFGRFGGHSEIGFDLLANAALTYAAAGATRQAILGGIARGVGQTAAHELAHAILGVSPVMDSTDDDQSYEFHSFARAAQYYGELHWAAARPALLKRLGP